jgi:CDP-diacylglycerol--serine O-phosphatidyltransferase
MLPMFVSFEWGDWIPRSPYLNAVWISVVALLMVSNVPTVSLKRIRIPPQLVVPTLLGIGLATAFFTTAPWPTLTCVGAVYLASIPLTIRVSSRLRRTAPGPRPAEPAEAVSPLPTPASLPAGGTAPPANEWRH